MEHNFMYALPELWIFLWQEHHAYSIVAGQPCASPILGAVNTAGRHSHVHPLLIAGVRHNCMQNQPAIARHPTWPMRMMVQPAALRSEEHTSELQSHSDLVCRLLLEK